MRKVSHPEGAEFSHEDHAAWEELTVLQGQVVEVLLSETGEDFPPDLWGGFLVVKVELGLEGDMILYAKSLGCDDPESTGGCQPISTDEQVASTFATVTHAR